MLLWLMSHRENLPAPRWGHQSSLAPASWGFIVTRPLSHASLDDLVHYPQNNVKPSPLISNVLVTLSSWLHLLLQMIVEATRQELPQLFLPPCFQPTGFWSHPPTLPFQRKTRFSFPTAIPPPFSVSGLLLSPPSWSPFSLMSSLYLSLSTDLSCQRVQISPILQTKIQQTFQSRL